MFEIVQKNIITKVNNSLNNIKSITFEVDWMKIENPIQKPNSTALVDAIARRAAWASAIRGLEENTWSAQILLLYSLQV